VSFLGGDKVAGVKMKDTTLWSEPNIGATNESGFTALPGGFRFQDGAFINMGFYALFWSSTEESGSNNACDLKLSCYYSFVSTSFVKKVDGFSVRCVKD